jgi:hypothetical protein
MKAGRHEPKYRTLPSHYRLHSDRLRSSSYFFKEVYPSRKVSSVYFDHPSMRCLNDAMFDNIKKFEVRLRWYNETIGGKVSYGMKEKEITTQEGFENYLFEILNNKFNIKTYLLSKEINIYKIKNSSEKLYFNFEGHWNNNGHRVIAQIMSNNIKKKK